MGKKEAPPPSKPSTTPASSTPANAPAAKCPEDCTKKVCTPKEVSETVSETISGAPAAYSAWNGTYGWSSKFRVEPSRSPCGVKVIMKLKVTGTVTDAQKAAWKSACEGKWSGKVKLKCPDPACTEACPGGYPVTVEIQWVDSGEHYTITANAAAATEGGRSGIGGTTSMTGWGVGDTTDVTHEFGHMLGNPEEYFTTDGTDYTAGGTKDGFRDADGGIMNNPSKDPKPNNFDAIKKAAASAMGSTCTVEAAGSAGATTTTTTYTVKEGDNLSKIGAKYGVSANAIYEANR